MTTEVRLGDFRAVEISEGVLTTWYRNDITDSMYITPEQAVNLASVLLQWATQNRSPVPPPPPATPAVLPRKER